MRQIVVAMISFFVLGLSPCFGETKLLSNQWRLEIVVPPAPITSAPFDIIVLNDSRILVQGNTRNQLVSVDLDGHVFQTGIPCGGRYFDVSDDGRIWFYSLPDGWLSVTTKDRRNLVKLPSIPIAHHFGSISVSTDGSIAYITSTHDDKSCLYRYTDGKVKLLAESPNIGEYQWVYINVEMADPGHVWITGIRGVYLLEGSRPVLFMTLSDFFPLCTTSDKKGNLYIAGRLGSRADIYKVTLKGKLSQVADLSDIMTGPTQMGIFWDDRRETLFAVHKEKHQIYMITEDGCQSLLNDNFLSTPIALAIRDDGEVFVNGDELGVQYVDRRSNVHFFCGNLVCFQPPAADMVFHSQQLYYTGAAPGFPSFIYSIDKSGKVTSSTQVKGLPAGIDITSDGQVLYADYETGVIKVFRPDKEDRIIAKGLTYPVGLVVGPNNTMYVSASDDDVHLDPHTTMEAPRRRLLKITEDGEVSEIFRFEHGDVTFFDIDQNGVLYIPNIDKLYMFHPNGRLTVLAQGFVYVRDAKFAPDGTLYVTDNGNSALYRLVPK